MACSYTQIPSNVAFGGYTSPINVENMLRNKVDMYSCPISSPIAESGLFNNAIPTTFGNNTFNNTFNTFNNFAGFNKTFAVEYAAKCGYAYGAECGAQLGSIVAARLNTFLGQEQAVQIGAKWCSEICAKLGQELSIKLVNGWSVEECARWCYTFGAQTGAELGAIIAQRLGAIYTAEHGARVCSSLFAELCGKLCYVIAARVSESRFGGINTWNNWNNTFGNNTFGLNNNTWTGAFGYPTTFGSNAWTGNNWNNWFNQTPFNAAVEKLSNIAFRPSSHVELYTLTNPIRVLDIEGNRQLYLCFELKGYKPEEVNVTLNKAEKAIVIEAVHDVKEGKEHAIARKYTRKFVLPESLAKIDLTKVELKSCLTQEGYLVVECQLPKMTTEEIAKCPTMSELYNKLPFFGNAAFANFGGFNSAINCNVNNVKPVTVKTA